MNISMSHNLNINVRKHNQRGTNIQRDMVNLRITHIQMYAVSAYVGLMDVHHSSSYFLNPE